MPPMGNIYESWNICGCETSMNEDYERDYGHKMPFSRTNRLEYGIRLFWQSTFTPDGLGNVAIRYTFKTRHNWARKTLPEVLELIQYLNQHENGLLKTYDEYTLTIMKTFEDFLDSDSGKTKNNRSLLQMLPVHKITLDSEYEQTIQVPPNLSPALVAGNN